MLSTGSDHIRPRSVKRVAAAVSEGCVFDQFGRHPERISRPALAFGTDPIDHQTKGFTAD
jgi:hypothetical protein